MKENNDIDLLGQLNKAEPPDYLYTRIEARIQRVKESKMPGGWALVTSFAVLLLLICNSWLITTNWSSGQEESTPSASIAREMRLNVSNQLYDE